MEKENDAIEDLFTRRFMMVMMSDGEQYSRWIQRAFSVVADAGDIKQVKNGTWTGREAATFALADEMKEFYEKHASLVDGGLSSRFIARYRAYTELYPDLYLVYADILELAMAYVNWETVAASIIGDFSEQI